MQTNRITALFSKERRAEMMRFIIVGIVATALQYGLYLLFVPLMHPTIANTLAYAGSFVFNFIASTRYTFRVKSTVKRGMGFAMAHLTNYLLQTVCLAFFIWTGIPKQWALLPVFAICVPVNFILVRFVMKPPTSDTRHPISE